MDMIEQQELIDKIILKSGWKGDYDIQFTKDKAIITEIRLDNKTWVKGLRQIGVNLDGNIMDNNI